MPSQPTENTNLPSGEDFILIIFPKWTLKLSEAILLNIPGNTFIMPLFVPPIIAFYLYNDSKNNNYTIFIFWV